MSKPFLAIILVLLSFSMLLPDSSMAAEAACVSAAEDWIAGLPDNDNHAALSRYAANTCAFSGRWVRQYAEAAPLHRQRTCKDLVLIWSHKQCNYFRDTFDPAAAEPCKAWSREMHSRCLAGDVAWFP